MFISFFNELKAAGVPVTLREYLMLMEAMERDLASRQIEQFYYLSRASLVKDERNLDKFDRVFATTFNGFEAVSEAMAAEIPTEWLKKLTEKYFTADEKAQIAAMGGLEKLLETLRQRLAEQRSRHQGGSKWIGTAGTSPYGAHGYNPEGVRIGQESNRNFGPSRSGTSASTRTLTTASSSGPGISSWRCAGCAGSPAPAPPRNSISRGPSKRPRTVDILN